MAGDTVGSIEQDLGKERTERGWENMEVRLVQLRRQNSGRVGDDAQFNLRTHIPLGYPRLLLILQNPTHSYPATSPVELPTLLDTQLSSKVSEQYG